MEPFSMPVSVSGGTAGPSNAQGSFMSSFGGMDDSGWNVNFGQGGSASSTVSSKAPSVASPASLGTIADQFGLPNNVAVTSNPAAAVSSSAVGLSPTVLVVLALVVVLALRKRHG